MRKEIKRIEVVILFIKSRIFIQDYLGYIDFKIIIIYICAAVAPIFSGCTKVANYTKAVDKDGPPHAFAARPILLLSLNERLVDQQFSSNFSTFAIPSNQQAKVGKWQRKSRTSCLVLLSNC